MKLSAIQRFTMLDFPGHVSCIAFTPGCNMRCGFCHNPEFVLPEKIREIQGSFIDEETFFRFLSRRKNLLDGVVVSGGEPTIWNDLPLFLKRIKEGGFSVKLDTNGNHPDMLEKLISQNLVDYVAMDVKASLGGYKKLVGGTVKSENIEKSISLLKQSTVEYEFRSTLIKEIHDTEMLDEMVNLLTHSKRVFLQIFRPIITLDPRFEKYHAFSREEMSEIRNMFLGKVDFVEVRAEST